MRRLFLLIFLIHFSLSVYANQTEYPVITPENVMNLQEVDVLEADAETVANRFLLQGADRILQYGADNSLRLLDAINFQEIAVLPMSASDLSVDSLHENNLLLVSTSLNMVIRIDVTTGEELVRYQTIAPAEMSYQVYISPDKRFLLAPFSSAEESLTSVWDFETGELLALPPNLRPIYPYFRANGQIFAWDITNEDVVFYELRGQWITFAFPAESANSQTIPPPPPRSLRLSPDGNILALGNADHVQLWNLSRQELIADLVLDWPAIDFSPSGRYFAYAADLNYVEVMEIETGESIQRIRHGIVVENLQFRHEDFIAVWGIAYPDERLFNIHTGETDEIPAMPHLQTENLNFYWTHSRIRIEDKEGNLLFEQEFAGMLGLDVSRDASRLFISYEDGRIVVWAVPE